MAVLALSLHFWGAREGCRLATGSSLPASLLFAAGIIVIPLAIPALQDVIAFSTTEFGYAAFAVSVALSLSAGLLTLRTKRLLAEVPRTLPETPGASPPSAPTDPADGCPEDKETADE